VAIIFPSGEIATAKPKNKGDARQKTKDEINNLNHI
jgi:hypothetical protein